MKSNSGTTNLIRTSLIVSLMAIVSLFSSNLYAKDPARVIAGWVEKVRIDNYDFKVKAKLDTGARTSSIHARDIKSFKKDGVRWVRFTLILTDSKDNEHVIKMEKPRSRRI